MFGMYNHPAAMLGMVQRMPMPFPEDRFPRRDEPGPRPPISAYEAVALMSRRRSRSASRDRFLRDRSPHKRGRDRSRSRTPVSLPKRPAANSSPRRRQGSRHRSRSRSPPRRPVDEQPDKRPRTAGASKTAVRVEDLVASPQPTDSPSLNSIAKKVLSQFEDPSRRQEPHTPLPTPPRRAAGEPFKMATGPLDYLNDPLSPLLPREDPSGLPPARQAEPELPRRQSPPVWGPGDSGFDRDPPQAVEGSAPLQAFRVPAPAIAMRDPALLAQSESFKSKRRSQGNHEVEDERLDSPGDEEAGSRSGSDRDASPPTDKEESDDLQPIRRSQESSQDAPGRKGDVERQHVGQGTSKTKIISVIPIIGNLPTRPSGGLPPPRRCASALQVLAALCEGLSQDVTLDQQLEFSKQKAQKEDVPLMDMLYAVDRMWRTLQDKHGIKRGHNYVLRPGKMAQQVLTAARQELDALLGASRSPGPSSMDKVPLAPLLQPALPPGFNDPLKPLARNPVPMPLPDNGSMGVFGQPGLYEMSGHIPTHLGADQDWRMQHGLAREVSLEMSSMQPMSVHHLQPMQGLQPMPPLQSYRPTTYEDQMRGHSFPEQRHMASNLAPGPAYYPG